MIWVGAFRYPDFVFDLTRILKDNLKVYKLPDA